MAAGPNEREQPVAKSGSPVVDRAPAAPGRQTVHSGPSVVAAAGNAAVARRLTAPRPAGPLGGPVARMARAGNGAVSRALAGPGAAGGTAPGGFAERLGSAESGQPIPDDTRDSLESSFGTSLADVRVHVGTRSARLASDVNANAFTVGRNIYFGQGQYEPGSRRGYHLLAHEVTHTLQQQGDGTPAASSMTVTDAADASEREAEAIATRVTAARSAAGSPEEPPPSPAAHAGIMRDFEATDLIPDFVLDGVRSAVRSVPGYTLLTYITGKDLLTDEAVAVDRAELVEKLLTYGPFGASVGHVLQAVDVLGDVYTLITDGLAANNLTLARIGQDIGSAWDEMSADKLVDGNVAIVRRYIDAILADVGRFVQSIVDVVIEKVRAVVAEVAEPHLESPEIKPTWDLARKVLHYDPLRGTEVSAPTVEILGDFLRLTGQDQVLAQMTERGTLAETAAWLDTQFATFAGITTDLIMLFADAWAAIQPQNLPNLLDTLPPLASRAFGLVQRIVAFATTIMSKVLELVKKSLLGWLSTHAYEVPGFRLLTVMIEQNPFTGDRVARTAENLVGGFIALLPDGEATYHRLAESGVIGEAAGRIEAAMTRLGISVDMVTGTFLGVWDTLQLTDLLAPIPAFERVLERFRDPLNRIVEFATEVVKVVVELILKLMDFPSDLIGSIISNTMAAIDDIERDPVAFLLNMVQALKSGVAGFFDNILTFLLDGLTAWLFRGLGQLGITRPPDLSLQSIVDLVLQVLGITADFLWERLSQHLGPERVARIRGAIDRLSGAWAFIREVQEGGVAAIWRHVVDKLSGLWDMVIDMAKNWIMTEIVEKVSVKLISMLDPTGVMAVINSVSAFISAVQSAIEYMRDILEVVNQYATTLAAVAAGNIVPGAQKVTQGLGQAIPIAIGFLARQIGIDNVPEKVVEIIEGLREMISEAVDWLIEQAVNLGTSAMSALGLGGEEGATEAEADPVDPGDHDALADRVIGELATDVDTDQSYEAIRRDREAQARVLEQRYTPMLEPGIALTVNFAAAATDAADNDLDFEVVIAPNTTRKSGKVRTTVADIRLEDGILHIGDKKFTTGALIQLRTSGGDSGRGSRPGLRRVPYVITRFAEVPTGGTTKIMVTFEPDRTNPRYSDRTPPGATILADSYGVQWIPLVEATQEIDEDEMEIENAKESWDDLATAKRVLNYRVSEHQTNNPAGMDWEHIVEHRGSHTEHSSRNLALTSFAINSALNAFYQEVRVHEPLKLRDVTEPIALREYVYGMSYDQQRYWKVEYAYRALGVSLSERSSERGKWLVLS